MATRTIANGGGNYTAIGSWVEGAVPTSADTVTATVTSGQLTINGTSVAGSVNLSAYTNTLSGAGTWTVSGNILFGTGMTITATGILTINASSTITSNGKPWTGTLTPSLTPTITLGDNFQVNAISHALAATAAITVNGNILSVIGNITMSAGRSFNGTTTFKCVGTGLITNGGGILNNFQIATSGTSTFSSTFTYNTGTFTYISGATDFTTNNTTIAVAAATTFDTGGITLNNMNFQTTDFTVTLNSMLNLAGTLTTSRNTTFGGIGGWSVSNFNCVTAGRTTTLNTGNTYTITSGITLTFTSASHGGFVSSSSGTKANLILNIGASQDIDFCDATDIDSSAGQTFWSYKGILSNTNNWNLIVPQINLTSTF